MTLLILIGFMKGLHINVPDMERWGCWLDVILTTITDSYLNYFKKYGMKPAFVNPYVVKWIKGLYDKKLDKTDLKDL